MGFFLCYKFLFSMVLFYFVLSRNHFEFRLCGSTVANLQCMVLLEMVPETKGSAALFSTMWVSFSPWGLFVWLLDWLHFLLDDPAVNFLKVLVERTKS